VSDFWQAPNNGVVLNLDHVVCVDPSPDGGGGLRVMTVAGGVWLTVKNDAAQGLLEAIGERMKGRSSQ
jgi:hypothetical protein